MPRVRVSFTRHPIDTFTAIVTVSTVEETEKIIFDVLDKYHRNADAVAQHYKKRWQREEDRLGFVVLGEV